MCFYQICRRLSGVLYAYPGGGGVLPYISHIGSRYVRPKGVWFGSRFGLKWGIDSVTISIRKGTWILIWDEYTS